MIPLDHPKCVHPSLFCGRHHSHGIMIINLTEAMIGQRAKKGRHVWNGTRRNWCYGGNRWNTGDHFGKWPGFFFRDMKRSFWIIFFVCKLWVCRKLGVEYPEKWRFRETYEINDWVLGHPQTNSDWPSPSRMMGKTTCGSGYQLRSADRVLVSPPAWGMMSLPCVAWRCCQQQWHGGCARMTPWPTWDSNMVTFLIGGSFVF